MECYLLVTMGTGTNTSSVVVSAGFTIPQFTDLKVQLGIKVKIYSKLV